MNITTAIEIIDAMRADYGLPFLEMLMEMGEMLANDELDNRQAVAYRVFMREGQRMMAPA
jgi:hypothetical protein|tara:strand:+ start:28 stop:207 length:180 start_codon:yes stop_codon:yes gene_type:complete